MSFGARIASAAAHQRFAAAWPIGQGVEDSGFVIRIRPAVTGIGQPEAFRSSDP